jgi:hypothetical protein
MNKMTSKTNWRAFDFLNAGDLTAIEDDIRYLHVELNKQPYNIPDQKHKKWDHSCIPDIGEIRRICENIKMISDHYYLPPKYDRLDVIAEKAAINNQDVNDVAECLHWLYDELKVRTRTHNTHQVIMDKELSHEMLTLHTHEEIQKERMVLVASRT